MLAGRIQHASADAHRHLTTIRNLLRDQPYPLERTRKELTLAEYAIDVLPARDNVPAIAICGMQTVERLEDLYRSIMGRMALIAEHVEHSLARPRTSSSSSERAAPAAVENPN